MLLTLAILISLTLGFAAFRLAPHLGRGRVVFDATPDRPAPFGYKMAWLAIRTQDNAAVLQALGVGGATVSNWNSGIGTVYDDGLGDSHVFVSPPVNGWTFVVGLALPYPTGRGFTDTWTPLMTELSGQFAEVHYYFSYPLIDFFAWARFVDHRLVRAFAVGDEGVISNRGRITAEERALGLKLFELRGVRGRSGDAGGELILHPTEDHVLRVAQQWSLDPTRLDQLPGAGVGLGWVAQAPARWRPEHLRKTG